MRGLFREKSHAWDWRAPRVGAKRGSLNAKRGPLNPTRDTKRVALGSLGVTCATPERCLAFACLAARKMNRRSALRAQPSGKVVVHRPAKPHTSVQLIPSTRALASTLKAA